MKFIARRLKGGAWGDLGDQIALYKVRDRNALRYPPYRLS